MNSAAEIGQAAQSHDADARPVKLACRNVWKLFDTNASRFIRAQRPGRHRRNSRTPGWWVRHAPSISRNPPRRDFHHHGAFGFRQSRRWCAACRASLSPPTARSSSRARICCRSPMRGADRTAPPPHGHRVPEFRAAAAFERARNIAFPLSIQGIDRPNREAPAREVIELVGLRGREHFYLPRSFSARRDVGIARSP